MINEGKPGHRIGSPDVNKVLRKLLYPVLDQHGFAHHVGRSSWRWLESCTQVLTIQAVGHEFECCTGWPSQSISVRVGTFFDTRFNTPNRLKRDDRGRPMPAYYQCEYTGHIEKTIEQSMYTVRAIAVMPYSSGDRPDVWWIEPDGTNVTDVVQDVIYSFETSALSWFDAHIEPPKRLVTDQAQGY